MDHDRYGLDGMPIACRQANTDPVTGLPTPEIPQAANSDQAGNPYVLPTVLVGMIVFMAVFVMQSGLLR